METKWKRTTDSLNFELLDHLGTKNALLGKSTMLQSKSNIKGPKKQNEQKLNREALKAVWNLAIPQIQNG